MECKCRLKSEANIGKSKSTDDAWSNSPGITGRNSGGFIKWNVSTVRFHPSLTNIRCLLPYVYGVNKGLFLDMNILVVDDEWSVAASVEAVLKRVGHVVDVLHDSADALARLMEWPDHYHVLITDHDMRRISGIELLEQLEGKLFGGKIVVMSGSMTMNSQHNTGRWEHTRSSKNLFTYMNCAKLSRRRSHR